MNRKDTYIDNMLISLLENWNDENPKSKLNPDLVCNIRLHLDSAYTVGMERAFRKVNREAAKYIKRNTQIPASLMRRILDPHTYEL